MPIHPKTPDDIPEREPTVPRREPPLKDPSESEPREPFNVPDVEVEDEPFPPA